MDLRERIARLVESDYTRTALWIAAREGMAPMSNTLCWCGRRGCFMATYTYDPDTSTHKVESLECIGDCASAVEDYERRIAVIREEQIRLFSLTRRSDVDVDEIFKLYESYENDVHTLAYDIATWCRKLNKLISCGLRGVC